MNSPNTHHNAGQNPHQHAAKIAEAVTTAWHTSGHSGRRDVPLSVVAALSFVRPPGPQGPDFAEIVLSQNVTHFLTELREVYTAFVNKRPDLMNPVYPLMNWLFDDGEPPPSLQRAAKATADAAVRAGQLDLTGTDQRFETDLLGVVLTELKSGKERHSQGQFYTPPDIASAIAAMLTPEEGMRVQDPAIGTGGMFRAAAQAMRHEGRNPANVAWYGADIDELAIAACAINAVVWGLGGHVILRAVNPLAEPEWHHVAEAQRDETVQLADTVRRIKAMRQLIEQLDGDD